MITQKLDPMFLEIFNERIPHLTDILEIEGVYLAGGLLRTLLSTDEVLSPEKTDIDIFFRDAGVLLQVQNYLRGTYYHQIFQCPEGKLATYVLFGAEEKWKLQLITVDYYSTIGDVINSFDFTVTMFGTDGEWLVSGETSLQDTLDKHLVWNKITYPSSSLRRMMKYARKGYWMEEPDYQELVTKIWEHHSEILDEKLVYVD